MHKLSLNPQKFIDTKCFCMKVQPHEHFQIGGIYCCEVVCAFVPSDLQHVREFPLTYLITVEQMCLEGQHGGE